MLGVHRSSDIRPRRGHQRFVPTSHSPKPPTLIDASLRCLLLFGFSRYRPVWLLASAMGLLWSTRDPLLGVGHGRARPDGRPTVRRRPLPRGRRRRQGHLQEGERQVQELGTTPEHKVSGPNTLFRETRHPGMLTRLLPLATSPPPSSRTAYENLADQFPALILDDQECFRTKDQYESLLALVPDQGQSSFQPISGVAARRLTSVFSACRLLLTLRYRRPAAVALGVIVVVVVTDAVEGVVPGDPAVRAQADRQLAAQEVRARVCKVSDVDASAAGYRAPVFVPEAGRRGVQAPESSAQEPVCRPPEYE